MQDRAWVLRICAQNPRNTLFLANQEYPLSPQDWNFSWRTWEFRSQVGQEYPPGLELIMGDLGSLGVRLVKNTFLQDWNLSWRT